MRPVSQKQFVIAGVTNPAARKRRETGVRNNIAQMVSLAHCNDTPSCYKRKVKRVQLVHSRAPSMTEEHS